LRLFDALLFAFNAFSFEVCAFQAFVFPLLLQLAWPPLGYAEVDFAATAEKFESWGARGTTLDLGCVDRAGWSN